MLELKNIYSGYRKSKILKNVDFFVDCGQIVSIIGPNGAGKSTLLKSIFNLCDIYSGKVIYKGGDITNYPTSDLIKEGICFSMQGRPIFSNLSVQENLELGLYNINNKKIITKKIKDIFTRFPLLEKKKKSLAFTLSGGQQQILSIARSLLQDPEVLLLDEPSLGLDPKTQKQIFNIIKDINKLGITIIMVEQNAKQAVEISDIVYILENGKVILKGNKSVLKNKKIKEIYFGGR
jgi:branched-chain amino acid transport system ATP-binding protein